MDKKYFKKLKEFFYAYNLYYQKGKQKSRAYF